MIKRHKILGFAPDIDPTTSGIFTDATRFVPSENGFRPMKSPEKVGLPALASDCRGAAVILKTDSSRRTFAGTQTELYESTGTAWNTVSSATYTGGAETRWRFAQFGDTTYAVNRADPMQYSSSGNFADRSGAPKATFIESVWPGFVMVFNYNDGSNDYTDGWFCSALNDDTDWTPAVATQCANGRLIDTPGAITGGKRLGQDVIAYKERSMYLGRYIGAPFVFEWQLLPGDIGCAVQEGIANVDTAHIFAGYENFYYFEGSRPISIGNPLKEWYNDNVDRSTRYKMQHLHDRDESNVYFWYADGDGTVRNALVYNYKRDVWGKAGVFVGNSIQATVEYLAGNAYTYDNLGTFYATYDDLPDIPYDSPFWTASTPQMALFQNDNFIYTLTGIPGNSSDEESSVTFNFNGDDEFYYFVSRVRVKFKNNDTDSVNLVLRNCDYIGGAVTTSDMYLMTNNKVDIQKSAHWHSVKLTFRGDYTIYEYSIDMEEEGYE